jgi:RNA polymerase sigma-70 factor (ECF subfamily)
MTAPSPVPDDQEILSALRLPASRDRAFKALLDKYAQRLYWHIRRMVISHEDANDVLQNVSIKIWKGLENFREESGLYTWLYRIATNEALTFLEAQRRKAVLSFEDFDTKMSNKLVAEKGFDARQAEWKLQKAILKLPEKQRLVFQLRYYDEMSYEKMHEITGTSVGALKASYHHAVKKVEAYLLE